MLDAEIRLNEFIRHGKIPNILIEGASGSGKRTLVDKLIRSLYDEDEELMRVCVMYIDCAKERETGSARENIKLFAKATVGSQKKGAFKSIVLLNGDHLSIDAQSALRRCIEIFSQTTRFFMTVTDRHGLMCPILSRFCTLHCVPKLLKDGSRENYHQSTDAYTMPDDPRIAQRKVALQKILKTFWKRKVHIMPCAQQLYNAAYTAEDLIHEIADCTTSIKDKIAFEFASEKAAHTIRDERLLMASILCFGRSCTLDKKQ